ncbi:MAG TPA: HTTM domain-containing protein, partial [Acidimicrobiales bacterium]|nr:HTTM domain-containing protein [Acidimicrobiales bacterium]
MTATLVRRSEPGRAAPRRTWWFEPVPRARVAWLRIVLGTFVWLDVLVTTPWVAGHAGVPAGLYQPLFVARVLGLPRPTPVLVWAVQVVVLCSAAVVVAGRRPRSAGVALFGSYLAWMLIAMSYGKVDHDRFAFLVALAVLPTVGPARRSDRQEDEAAGWAVRCIQVAVVLTYLLAAAAKLRFGGIEWLDGSTLMRAVLRRGTFLTDPLVDNPWTLHAAQYALVAFELASPLMLVPGRLGRWFVGAAFAFHLV